MTEFMLVLRVLLLFLYIGGFVGLQRYLREHPYPVANSPTQRWRHPWMAIRHMWMPSLWFVPGLFWIGILNQTANVLIMSFMVPLSLYMLFMVVAGTFPLRRTAPRRRSTQAEAESVESQSADMALELIEAYGEVVPTDLPQANSLNAALGTVDRAISIFLIAPVMLVTLLSLIWALRSESPLLLLTFLLSISVPVLVSIVHFAASALDQVPLEEATGHRWKTAMSMIIGLFTGHPKPAWVIEDGKVQERIKGNAFLGHGVGWLLTEPENVVVLRRGVELTRVAGPGVVLMEGAETPYRVVDLRNQIRSVRVNAVTRDGIQVRVPLSSLFRLSPGSEPVLKQAWPYRSEQEILKVLNAEEVDPLGKTPLETHDPQPWEDLPLRVASHRAQQVISLYSVDQLYADGAHPELAEVHSAAVSALGIEPLPQSDLDDPLARVTIGKIIRKAVQKALQEPLGFEIHGGSIGNRIEPLNPSVTKARVEAWKARMTAEVMMWQAELQTKSHQLRDRIELDARAQLLQDLIDTLAASLKGAGEEYRDNMFAYHLLSHLIQMAHRPAVRELLPETAVPTLNRLVRTTKDG